MENSTTTIEFKFERIIPAYPTAVYDAWLNPKIPGTPWNKAEKVIMDAKVDGLFWFIVMAGYPHAHYGRFLELDSPDSIKLTWMSQNTQGLESVLTLSFKPAGRNTLLTLEHSGLPDTEGGRDHEAGWNYFLDVFADNFK